MHPVPDSGVKRIALDTGLRNEVDAIAETAYYIWERGWSDGSAGNMSVEVTASMMKKDIHPDEYRAVSLPSAQRGSGDRYFLVTARGARFRELAHRPDETLLLIYVVPSGQEYRVLWGGEENRATSELCTHLAVHAALLRSDRSRGAVVHVHPPHMVALTQIGQYAAERHLNELLLSMHPEVRLVMPGGIGCVPYVCPGTQDLADATARSIMDRSLVVWAKHGCLAVGRDVHEAFDIIASAEKAAEIFFLCRSAGFEPEGLTPEHIRELGLRSQEQQNPEDRTRKGH